LRPAERAVPDRQGAGVLRAQGEPRRAGLPAPAAQPARRRVVPPRGQRAAARHRAKTIEHLARYPEPPESSLLGAARRAEFIEGIKGKAARALGDFAKMMDDLGQFLQAQPDEVIRQVLDRTGYRQMLKDSKDDEDAERLANIEELITAARQFAEQD